MILKNLWNHKKQNGFVFVEIVLIAVLSFYLIDHITVWAYGNYFCRADGEFEKEHLLVAQTGRTTAIHDSISNNEDLLAPLFAFRDEVRSLPEVQSVCLTHGFIGDGQTMWNPHPLAPEADSTRICSSYPETFVVGQCYFETLGITPLAGSPSAESLSRDIPIGSVVITRSLAVQLFGTAEAVGRRLVQVKGTDDDGTEIVTRHTVYGVVEDVKPAPHERHFYVAFFPVSALSGNTPKMLIRLKPDADATAFIARSGKIKTDAYALASLNTYDSHQAENPYFSDQTIIVTLLSTLGLLFALNVILGTLGTFWLQIRKRTEDIGIMRSFGAKRRNIFWMVWGEGALLTLLACILGQLIWLQFALNIGLADGGVRATSLHEADWVNTFWLHFLVVCAMQYLLLLAIVTLGMVIPTFRAMYKRPVEALHHE